MKAKRLLLVIFGMTIVTLAYSQSPIVVITYPHNNDILVANPQLLIKATATDNGTVDSVKVFKGSTFLGNMILNSGEYSFQWISPAIGTYILTIKAQDNEGNWGESFVQITHNAATKPYATHDTLTFDCAYAKGMKYYIQIPQQRPLPDNMPIFMMFHQAGGDSATTRLWMDPASSVIKPAISDLRTRVNDRAWVYLTPYHYDSSPWSKTDAALDACYNNMIDSVKNMLTKEYKCKADTNPLYLGGESYGGQVAIHLAKANPNKYKGMLICYAQIYIETPNIVSVLTDYQSSTYPMPVFFWSSPSESYKARAMTRLYRLLKETNNTTKFVLSDNADHSPVNFPSKTLLEFWDAGNTHKQQYEQWYNKQTVKVTMDPYDLRNPADSSREFYYAPEANDYNYTFATADTFAQKPANNKYTLSIIKPIIVPGWPVQERNKHQKLFFFRENDPVTGSIPYGSYGLGCWTSAEYYAYEGHGQFYTRFADFTRYVNTNGWLWVAPASFEYKQMIKEVNTKFPEYNGNNYGAGIGYGGKRLAKMVLDYPSFHSGLIFIEPQLDYALVDSLVKVISSSLPVVISIRNSDTTQNGKIIRYFYAQMKANGKTVMLMERDMANDCKHKGLNMHSGYYEMDFIRNSKYGSFRKVSVAYADASYNYPLKYTVTEEGINTITKLTDADHLNLIELFPNPVNNKLNIVAKNYEKCTVELYNILGTRQGTWTFDNELQVDLSGYPSGSYIVKTIHKGHLNTYKIVKD